MIALIRGAYRNPERPNRTYYHLRIWPGGCAHALIETEDPEEVYIALATLHNDSVEGIKKDMRLCKFRPQTKEYPIPYQMKVGVDWRLWFYDPERKEWGRVKLISQDGVELPGQDYPTEISRLY